MSLLQQYWRCQERLSQENQGRKIKEKQEQRKLKRNEIIAK